MSNDCPSYLTEEDGLLVPSPHFQTSNRASGPEGARDQQPSLATPLSVLVSAHAHLLSFGLCWGLSTPSLPALCPGDPPSDLGQENPRPLAFGSVWPVPASSSRRKEEKKTGVHPLAAACQPWVGRGLTTTEGQVLGPAVGKPLLTQFPPGPHCSLLGP